MVANGHHRGTAIVIIKVFFFYLSLRPKGDKKRQGNFMMKLLPLILLFFWWLLLKKIALLTAPKKSKIRSATKLSKKAEKLFWDSFHKGDYQNIDKVLFYLQGGLILEKNPNNPKPPLHRLYSYVESFRERKKLQ